MTAENLRRKRIEKRERREHRQMSNRADHRLVLAAREAVRAALAAVPLEAAEG